MKILIFLAIALLGFGAYNHHVEEKREAAMEQADAIIRSYDFNNDGVLSEDEQNSLIENLYTEAGGDEMTLKELEDAMAKAQEVFKGFDEDGDGDLSYDEKLSVVQWVYEKYDNGEIKNDMLRQILKGYENKVNELNYYHELLNECGVGGGDWYIELRPDKNND